jgi:hypothetical protein
MSLRDQALLQGYTLKPLVYSTVQTLQDVRDGLDRASKIARRRRIAQNAASNRLAAVRALGVVDQVGKDGRELLFAVSELGEKMRWFEPEMRWEEAKRKRCEG